MAVTAERLSSGRRWHLPRLRGRRCAPYSRRSRTYSSPACRVRSRLMRSGVYLIAAALTIGVVGSVAAQGQPTLRLTLEDALSKAGETSHRLPQGPGRAGAGRAGGGRAGV